MKTILVPTDFSKISLNALDYAVQIALKTKAKIILFHTYYMPIITSDIMVIPPIDELDNGCSISLKKIENNIYKKHGKIIDIEFKCKYGFPIDEINEYAKERKADLIVMGMQGAGYLSEKIIGSVTTSLIRKSKCPVLAIDQNIKFKPIKKIVLASDFDEISNITILNPLKEFVHLFKSQVDVLNVVPELETVPMIRKSVVGIKLENALEDVNHNFYFLQNEDVVEGINDFISENNADMVVTIPRKHSFLENIFNEPDTTRIAFHTTVPLLALHE
jgi:nucleotide-binding universal stress UspA family protein